MSDRRPLPPPTPAEEAHAREMRAFVHEHAPELVPFLQELAAAGMFAGWRTVKRARRLTDPEWTTGLGVMARGNGREFSLQPKESQ